jgi:hypothetical protein
MAAAAGSNALFAVYNMVSWGRFMSWIEKVADFLSWSAPYVFIIAVITGALLLLPQSVTEFLGIDDWRTLYRPWIGVAAFIATLYFLAGLLDNALAWIFQRLKNKQRLQQERYQRHKLLHHLTAEESRYLLHHYIERWSQTAYFDPADAVIEGLVVKGILYPAPEVKNRLHELAFKIQGWAYKYLSEHPELLKKRA